MNEDFDSFKQSILHAIRDITDQFRALENGVLEYKKTVNAAIGILSKELLGFMAQTEAAIAKDAEKRQKRQKRQDVKDIAIGCFLCLTLAVGCSIISMLIYILIEAGYVIR